MYKIGPIATISREAIKDALKNVDMETTPQNEERKIARRYDSFCTNRRPFLEEAQELSQAVLPYLFPPEGEDPLSSLAANQSLVAKGVINLAKSLGSTIHPPNARFFKNTVPNDLAKMMEQLKAEEEGEVAKEAAAVESEINNALVARDEVIRQLIKATPDSENFYVSMIYNIVSGTVCFFKPNLETSKIYTLEDFVAQFDNAGDLLEVIVRDDVHPSKFTPEQLKKLFGSDDLERWEDANQTFIPVYTRQVRRFDHWEIQVEIAGKRFAEMEGKEELDAPPFIVYPFLHFPKLDYGISWVTHNKGDIIEFENLSLAKNELAKAASKVVAIIPPDMKVTQKELADNSGMSYIFGAPNPIQMVLADVSRNLDALRELYEIARNSLMGAFLLTQAIQRNAERVSAEEIRTMMQGLRDLLGGLYLSLARRYQYVYLRRITRLAERAGKIPVLPEDSYQLVLTAGLETLESAENLQAMDQLMARIFQLAGVNPEIAQRINAEEYIYRTGNDLSVVTDKLILSDEELQDKLGVRMIVEMARQMGPQGPAMLAQGLQAMMQQAEAPQGGEAPPPESQEVM